jgi:glyoxylase-like metal-dependent hydrolase (beta-lactamase superfamily II)
MFNKVFFLMVLMTVLMVVPGPAESIEGLPLHIQKIGDNVVRVWVGDHISSTAVCAIATKKGIVVIDTTNIPKLDQAFRKVIARELGRNDFKYLINTHGHVDHVSGNGVYSDCLIIAHENVKGMMEEMFKGIPGRIEWITGYIKEQQKQLASGKVEAEKKAAVEEQLVISTLTQEYLESSPQPTFPKKTFRDKLVLDCGDVTFELYQAGGTHTRSDIFIFVPEKGILFTGDMMADKWLTDTPGCLATFAAHSGEVEDFPVLLKNWQLLVDQKEKITSYIPGHWNGELSFAGFRNRLEYLKTLLIDMQAMVLAGTDYNQFLAGYTLKTKFPQLVDSPGITNQGHYNSIEHLYQIFSGKISLPQVLWRMAIDNRFAGEFDKLKQDVMNARKKYFYTEGQLNSQGYSLLLEQKQVENAIKMFELTAELFPASWNAYDSLAEAYDTKGDKQKALELYKRSLELNPDNENGKKRIERIEKELNT